MGWIAFGFAAVVLICTMFAWMRHAEAMQLSIDSAEAWSRAVENAKAKVIKEMEADHLEALARANQRTEFAEAARDRIGEANTKLIAQRDAFGAQLEDAHAAAETYRAQIAREVETLRDERDQWREAAIAAKQHIDAARAALAPKV